MTLCVTNSVSAKQFIVVTITYCSSVMLSDWIDERTVKDFTYLISEAVYRVEKFQLYNN